MDREHLAEAVREIAFEETNSRQVLAWDRLTSRPDRPVSELEFMSRLWGYVYGVAYGIAREDRLGEGGDEAVAALAFEVFNDDGLHGMEIVRRLEGGKATV